MPMLGHMVYFTLKEPTQEKIEGLVASCKEHLSGHPGTTFFAAGTLVPDLDREVNQRDFHVALQLVFESREAHDIYQVSERHITFIETNMEDWASVKVFDADVTS